MYLLDRRLFFAHVTDPSSTPPSRMEPAVRVSAAPEEILVDGGPTHYNERSNVTAMFELKPPSPEVPVPRRTKKRKGSVDPVTGQEMAICEEETDDTASSRISKSCDACKGKKIACAGGKPLCEYCLKHNFQCVYRRMRKPGLKAGYGKEFTGRLEFVELQLMNLQLNEMEQMRRRVESLEQVCSKQEQMLGEMAQRLLYFALGNGPSGETSLSPWLIPDSEPLPPQRHHQLQLTLQLQESLSQGRPLPESSHHAPPLHITPHQRTAHHEKSLPQVSSDKPRSQSPLYTQPWEQDSSTARRNPSMVYVPSVFPGTGTSHSHLPHPNEVMHRDYPSPPPPIDLEREEEIREGIAHEKHSPLGLGGKPGGETPSWPSFQRGGHDGEGLEVSGNGYPSFDSPMDLESFNEMFREVKPIAQKDQHLAARSREILRELPKSEPEDFQGINEWEF